MILLFLLEYFILYLYDEKISKERINNERDRKLPK